MVTLAPPYVLSAYHVTDIFGALYNLVAATRVFLTPSRGLDVQAKVAHLAANCLGSLSNAVGGRREDDNGEKDEQIRSECRTQLKPFLGSFDGLRPYANFLIAYSSLSLLQR